MTQQPHSHPTPTGPLAPGWYAVPGVDNRPDLVTARWWNGTKWLGFGVRGGNVERYPDASGSLPMMIVAMGLLVVLEILLMSMLLSIGAGIGAVLLVSGILLAGLAVLVVMTMRMARARRRIEDHPRPVMPVVPAAVRPVPGDVEGSGAGWYPSPTPDFQRYWTGARWAEYARERGVPVPTYGLDQALGRGIRGLLALSLGCGVAALAAVVAAIFGVTWIGVVLAIMFAVCALAVVLSAMLMRSSARRFRTPAGPPVAGGR